MHFTNTKSQAPISSLSCCPQKRERLCRIIARLRRKHASIRVRHYHIPDSKEISAAKSDTSKITAAAGSRFHPRTIAFSKRIWVATLLLSMRLPLSILPSSDSLYCHILEATGPTENDPCAHRARDLRLGPVSKEYRDPPCPLPSIFSGCR